ncbi:MAG: hypothetical protein ACD_62C00186G0004 [uncultured bacterium]|nr:MAG: hypothetical protein ACD_62C00186G0004 [uncultured bacterium]
MFILWSSFIVLVILLMALDLGVLNRKAHIIGAKEALGWTAFWISLALLFNIVVFFIYEHHWFGMGLTSGEALSGKQAVLQFLTGYIIEESLSMDNIFVIAMIFAYFKVPNKYQHRVLFWGILGAIVFRMMMILAGSALIHRFVWMIYVFGALLVITAFKMFFSNDKPKELEHNYTVIIAKKFLPLTHEFHENRFVIKLEQKTVFTPLFLCLMVIETTDIFFAIDSIPAIFAITRDPFIVFTSNIFAILGLRSLYFALAAMMAKFHYIKVSLVFILGFVGVKMLASHYVHIPTWASLCVICLALIGGVLASLYIPGKKH